MKILVTGVAGFIGFHLAKRLLAEGNQVYGVDNLNNYYDVGLKQARLRQLLPNPKFTFEYLDLSDRLVTANVFSAGKFEVVVHLAAQAGVRYSLENPHAYVDSNLIGFTNILEGCRHNPVQHLIFASSSSIYGKNTQVPFSVADPVDSPVSLYAATKKANELMAHAYSHLYQIPTTGLRFFTVYGPWGRPDMAYYKFVQAIAEDQPIDVYNYGKMMRDFTYIDDVITGIVKLIPHQTKLHPPYKIYNLGNNHPIELQEFIATIETLMGKFAQKNFLPMQPGDVVATYADVTELMNDIGFKPTTSVAQGLASFVNWYCSYYGYNTVSEKSLPSKLSTAV